VPKYDLKKKGIKTPAYSDFKKYTDIRSIDVSNKNKNSINFFHSAKEFKARESSKY
jgi:hypothetical protein